MSVELFSVRQIAHEIILTLGQEFTQLRGYLDEYKDYIEKLESIELEKDAASCLQNGELDRALEFCEKSLEKNPDNLNAINIKKIILKKS